MTFQSLTRERLLNELRETEEASRRQAEVLVKVSGKESLFSLKLECETSQDFSAVNNNNYNNLLIYIAHIYIH